MKKIALLLLSFFLATCSSSYKPEPSSSAPKRPVFLSATSWELVEIYQDPQKRDYAQLVASFDRTLGWWTPFNVKNGQVRAEDSGSYIGLRTLNTISVSLGDRRFEIRALGFQTEAPVLPEGPSLVIDQTFVPEKDQEVEGLISRQQLSAILDSKVLKGVVRLQTLEYDQGRFLFRWEIKPERD